MAVSLVGDLNAEEEWTAAPDEEAARVEWLRYYLRAGRFEDAFALGFKHDCAVARIQARARVWLARRRAKLEHASHQSEGFVQRVRPASRPRNSPTRRRLAHRPGSLPPAARNLLRPVAQPQPIGSRAAARENVRTREGRDARAAPSWNILRASALVILSGRLERAVHATGEADAARVVGERALECARTAIERVASSELFIARELERTLACRRIPVLVSSVAQAAEGKLRSELEQLARRRAELSSACACLSHKVMEVEQACNFLGAHAAALSCAHDNVVCGKVVRPLEEAERCGVREDEITAAITIAEAAARSCRSATASLQVLQPDSLMDGLRCSSQTWPGRKSQLGAIRARLGR